MRRYWLSQESFLGDRVVIEGDVFHHICQVCRQGEGDKFEVLLGDGQVHLVELTKVSKKRAEAKVLESRQAPVSRAPRLHLVLSVPKFPVLENVLQKSVELGVYTLHLVATDFAFIKKRQVLDQKWGRWQKVILAACQQSARPEPMNLEFCDDLELLLAEINRDDTKAGLFFYEGDGQEDLRSKLASQTQRKPSDWYYFVGSEGGYSDREVELFSSFGFAPLSLGSQVLRVETACVSITSILKYELEV